MRLLRTSGLVMSLATLVSWQSLKAANTSEVGNHGGRVLRNTHRVAEVSVSPRERSVTVYLDRNPEGNPRAVEITLYDENHKPFTFELNALSFKTPGATAYRGTLPPGLNLGQGLSPGNQSHMGLELRIPLSKGAPEVLRGE
jgi:hypothetical protein